MKIKLDKIMRKIGYLMIIIFPLDIYRINLFGIGLSLFRFFFIILILMFLLRTLLKKSINSSLLYAGLYLFLFSTIRSFLLVNNFSFGHISYLLNVVMGLTLIFIFINIYDKKIYVYKLIKCFFVSTIIVMFFHIYTFYNHLIIDNPIKSLPFLNVIPFNLESPDLYFATFKGVPRFSLPFGKSTHVSIFIAIAIILLIGWILENRKFEFKIMIYLFYLIIMIMTTMSRSGVFSLVLSLILVYLLSFFILSNSNMKLLNSIVAIISIITIIVLILLLPYYNKLFETFVSRFFKINFSNSRHLQIRLDGVKLFFSSLKNFFLGVGFLNAGYKLDIINELSNLHTSYLTVLVERGILGFFSTFTFYIMLFYYSLKISILKKDFFSLSMFASMLCLMISFLFYDFMYILNVWIFLSIFSSYVNIYLSDI